MARNASIVAVTLLGLATAALAQLAPLEQRALDDYRSALASVEPIRGVEPAWSAFAALREALLRRPDGQKTVLESLSDAELVRLQRELPGARVARDEFVLFAPNIAYFTRLAATRGHVADRDFFAALGVTYPRSGWPVYVDQQTDSSGCTRFGSMTLVDTYGIWIEFRRQHPDHYVSDARAETERVLDELTSLTCVCGGADGVEAELRQFRARFPMSPARSTVDARLESLRTGRSNLRFSCVAR